MSEHSKKFPKYLHKPLMILWFELDEFIVFIVGFALSAMKSGLWHWFLLPVFVWYYMRIKRKNARGFLKHALYMLGFTKMQGYPEYFEKEFAE